MKGRLIITVILGLIILSCFSSPTFAGVDATPWHTQLNKLNSVMNVVDSINRRLARLADVLPPDPAKLRMPAPEGVIGMLEAIATQLHVSNDQIMNTLSGVPMKPEPLEIKIVLMDINREVMETVNMARMGIRYENEKVRNAFMKVQTAAEMIIMTMEDWMMNSIYVVAPFDETVCFIGYPCYIVWDTSNIQNYPIVWLEVVYADGSECCGNFWRRNTGSWLDWLPDPSWADPGNLCQPFRIKVYTEDKEYWGVSGLFKVGIHPTGCTW